MLYKNVRSERIWNNLAVKSATPGIYFNYLYCVENYYIGKKTINSRWRSLNILLTQLIEIVPTINIDIWKGIWKGFCINYKNNVTKLMNWRLHIVNSIFLPIDHFKNELKVRIESVESFQDRIYQTQVKLQDSLKNLNRNQSQMLPT